MGILDIFRALKDRLRHRPLDEWFKVTLDDEGVHFDVDPPGKDSWKDYFAWKSVERICFKDEGLYASDVYYIFTNVRPESFVLPSEAGGGQEFVEEMLKRNLFDEQLFVKAMGETSGRTYCWPPLD